MLDGYAKTSFALAKWNKADLHSNSNTTLEYAPQVEIYY